MAITIVSLSQVSTLSRLHIYLEPRRDGTWKGWIEFVPLDPAHLRDAQIATRRSPTSGSTLIAVCNNPSREGRQE